MAKITTTKVVVPTVVIANVTAEIKVHDRTPAFSGREGRSYRSNCRVYFSHEDENILEGFGNRVARPVDAYKRFLPEVAKVLGLAPDTKFRWSQYAGCSCPCSPGFICNEITRKDVWVSLSKEIPKTSNDPKQLALAANLVGQLVGQLSAEQRIASKVDDEDHRDRVERLLQ